ncbi:hypothetical protein DFJ74DRAFT_649776 [Hyaloraphidium curvatum]|nr:hypothetical protein DFJ74DRAFT_649776 [Hyaloraphidium curvatum]
MPRLRTSKRLRRHHRRTIAENAPGDLNGAVVRHGFLRPCSAVPRSMRTAPHPSEAVEAVRVGVPILLCRFALTNPTVPSSEFPVPECTLLFGMTGSGKTSLIHLLREEDPTRNTGKSDTAEANMQAIIIDGRPYYIADMPGFLDTNVEEGVREQLIQRTVDFLRKSTKRISKICFVTDGTDRMLPEAEEYLQIILALFRHQTELAVVLTKLNTPKQEKRSTEFMENLVKAFEPDIIIPTGEDRMERMQEWLKRPSEQVLDVDQLPIQVLTRTQLEDAINVLSTKIDELDALLRDGGASPEELEARIQEIEKQIPNLRSWWCSESKKAKKKKEKDELEEKLKEIRSMIKNKEDISKQLKELQRIFRARAEATVKARRTFWGVASAAASYVKQGASNAISMVTW